MSESHYSLRWNNHQAHMLNSFEALFQTESLVDVTLVCEEISIRAHKVVLSAGSPLFEKIISENPCRHPVIVLKDYTGWEIQSVVDFMYKGEISVAQEHLQSLIKAAESLQVRGLAQDNFETEKEFNTITNETASPAVSPIEFDRNFFSNRRNPNTTITTTPTMPHVRTLSPFITANSLLNYESGHKLPHMNHLNFTDPLVPRSDSQSPIPRRKQARPRRRSGELCVAQDLTTNNSTKSVPPSQDVAENLSVKRKLNEFDSPKSKFNKVEVSKSPELDISVPLDKDYKDYDHSPSLSIPPVLNLHQEMDTHSTHSPLPFPQLPSVSALAMSSPKFFGLESPLSLFPNSLEACRNPLLEMADPRNTPDQTFYNKKKIGRPKGQHSAPRGGPPRSWTNAELTEALQQVWYKKMTTSQASRVFGIPYNSLLMYVRGKYGKSLKLEQLRQDCINGTPPDYMGSLRSNNNNNCKSEPRDLDTIQPNTRPSSREQQSPPQPHMFHQFPPNFFPEFGSFPMPVNMIHLLPQSEKNRDLYSSQSQQQPIEVNSKCDRVKLENENRELIKQNGQN